MKDKVISTISEIEDDIDIDIDDILKSNQYDDLKDNVLDNELAQDIVNDNLQDNIMDDVANDIINNVTDNSLQNDKIASSNEQDIFKKSNQAIPNNTQQPNNKLEKEIEFLQKMKSRLIVVFEGLQSPNNRKIEAKIDLILNFLEYNLAMINDRVDTLKQENL